MKKAKRRMLRALFGVTFGFVLAADDTQKPASSPKEPARRRREADRPELAGAEPDRAPEE
jgi:hypothetical protein